MMRQGLLELNFDKVHAGVTKEFEMLIDRSLSAMEGGIEVHEESGGDVVGRSWIGCEVKNHVSFIHQLYTFRLNI